MSAAGRRTTGSANIADATIDLNVPGMEPLNLVTLPVNPAPNTKVIVVTGNQGGMMV